ncbi:iron-sulfur cluster repair di-iron protein [Brumimicrobium salinarum]|uniref:Iron-sulfur cluster repair di-iron protein n=1 Tax=Brumimicrobium salinarum TaxID=2058658 RepID=A0A2I0R3Z5_9FLAO|nr:DUF542 domain-containing protein [Brumimicrobium salinarum]PKR81120.1 iron-sulfur cluster repair di-iron protein [Brumimicrobium salinarum]
MKHILNQKVSDLAVKNFAILQFFIEHQIDFYCEGNLSLEEAIKKSDLDQKEILSQIEEINKQDALNYSVDIENWPLDLLADYIQKTHHKFTEEALVELKDKVDAFIADSSGDQKMTIVDFKVKLNLLAKELGGHMKKEELILFPFIRKMVSARKELEAPRFGTVQKPIDMMIHEHDTAFQLLVEIRKLFNDYKIESDMNSECENIVLKMKCLDCDLQHHLHLENNILFPKTVELEKNKVTS